MAESELVQSRGSSCSGPDRERVLLHGLPVPYSVFCKCISPQLTLSENSSVWVVRGRVHPFTCGLVVIVSNELSTESFRISSKRLCPSGLVRHVDTFPEDSE